MGVKDGGVKGASAAALPVLAGIERMSWNGSTGASNVKRETGHERF
jgi:hypothetical protein